MGARGPGLYQDDKAKDLKSTIALLSTMPASGDRILEILLANQSTPPALDRDGGPTFWLVVADRFEQLGIECNLARDRALEAIDGGYDLQDLERLEMGAADLRKRAKGLAELRGRLMSPRALRPRPKASKPQSRVVMPGEVWAVPTMRGYSMNPYSGKEALGLYGGSFEADGWGALIILDGGLAYDWFPWCTYSPVAIQSTTMPTIDQVRESSLAGGELARGVPRPKQLKRMGAQLIDRLPLDEERAKAAPVSQFKPPEYVVYAGWPLQVYASKERDGATRVVDLLVGAVRR